MVGMPAYDFIEAACKPRTTHCEMYTHSSHTNVSISITYFSRCGFKYFKHFTHVEIIVLSLIPVLDSTAQERVGTSGDQMPTLGSLLNYMEQSVNVVYQNLPSIKRAVWEQNVSMFMLVACEARNLSSLYSYLLRSSAQLVFPLLLIALWETM